MAKNAKTLSAMQTQNDPNTTNYYQDDNNGVLYNLVNSKNIDSFTVTFFNEQTLKEITEILNAEYTFKTNSNGSGTIATTEAGSQKVVLNLYNSKKLLIQGAGSWEWRNTAFRDISRKLTPCNVENTQINPGNTPNRLRSESAKVVNMNSSPINKTVDRLINEIISPRAASTPVNLKTANTQNALSKSSTAKPKKTPSKLSALAGSNSNQDDRVNDLATEDETCVKQSYTMDNNHTTNKASSSTEVTSQITTFKSELEKQKKENKELQKTSRDLLTQAQTLKKENEKLRNAVGAKESEINIAKKKLQENSKTIKQHEQKIKELQNKNASASADRLMLGEQNTKLKDEIKDIKAEKLKLVDILMQNTGASDTIESKLERGFEDLKEELSNEIKQIKDQISKSMEITGRQSATSPMNTDNNERNLSQNIQNPGLQSTSANKNQHAKTVFIAGDDTTSVLSPRILSDSNMTVKIKTHRGGRIITLKNTLEKLASDSSDSTKNMQAVVLHAGANDISDAQPAETVANELKKAASIIRTVNPETKILISSITPRRNDRLVNSAISEANHSIKNTCQEHDFMFIDNDKSFYKDTKPDVSLYRDGINLNKKGGKFLGQNIQEALRAILVDTEPHRDRGPRQTADKKDFRHRAALRREDHPRPMMPPWMAFYPPWMPAHPPPHYWK